MIELDLPFMIDEEFGVDIDFQPPIGLVADNYRVELISEITMLVVENLLSSCCYPVVFLLVTDTCHLWSIMLTAVDIQCRHKNNEEK